MIVRFANVLYWTAVAVSVFLIFMLGVGAIVGTVTDTPTQITLAVIAALIFVAGRAVLYVFAAR